MTRPRLETLQWFGLLAGPLAFAVEHVVGVFAVMADCNPARLGVPVHPVQAVVTAIAAIVIVLGELAAYQAYSQTKDAGWEGDPPPGRIHFLATASLAIGPLFLALVLLEGLGAVFHSGCGQA
jgi:hypothetical protein